MIVRILAVFVMLVALAPLQAPSAQASAAPIFAADTFLSALNAGDEEAAVAAFAPDAVATLARGDTYRGQAAMVDLVRLMVHAGRSYEIVQAHLVDDTLTLQVDVSDHGIRWAESTVVVEVQGGKLQTFRETAFRLRLGS